MSDLDRTYDSDSDEEFSQVGNSEVIVHHFDTNEDSTSSSDQDQLSEESETEEPDSIEQAPRENGTIMKNVKPENPTKSLKDTFDSLTVKRLVVPYKDLSAKSGGSAFAPQQQSIPVLFHQTAIFVRNELMLGGASTKKYKVRFRLGDTKSCFKNAMRQMTFIPEQNIPDFNLVLESFIPLLEIQLKEALKDVPNIKCSVSLYNNYEKLGADDEYDFGIQTPAFRIINDFQIGSNVKDMMDFIVARHNEKLQYTSTVIYLKTKSITITMLDSLLVNRRSRRFRK
jgi:hypothetical protein